MRYRKKPVVIEAKRVPSVFHIEARCAFEDWINPIKGDRTVKWRGEGLVVETLEGDMAAQPGDWIIRGVKGELYPCKPDIFEATYEPVEEPTS